MDFAATTGRAGQGTSFGTIEVVRHSAASKAERRSPLVGTEGVLALTCCLEL